MNTAEKLQQLRSLMQQHHIDAYIVMSADPHMSEYLPEYWKSRQWLSGFDGSVGTLVICQNFAGLWVDGRYWLQAETQLQGSGFELQKLSHDPKTTHIAWLAKHLKAGARIAVDGQSISIQHYQALEQIAQEKSAEICHDLDLITEIWIDRPELPLKPVRLTASGFDAYNRLEKIAQIRAALVEHKVEAHFISAVDDIAWILNCRGQDVEYNPIFLAHLLITASKVVLFIDRAKLSDVVATALALDHIELVDYQQSVEYLSKLQQHHILLDPAKVSLLHYRALSNHCQIKFDVNPSTVLKAQKAATEIEHIRHAMLKDGIALCQFFSWLEQALAQQQELTELDIDREMTAYRAKQDGFIGLSFATIAGFNANGALPHYRATQQHHALIKGNGLLLIDSGAQYLDGTTDITRVVPVGVPTKAQCRDYTLVLKAHIALARAVFPEALAAPLLDAICRQVLWQQGLDYRHGTGHGVGYALNVHEGPQVLSYSAPITAYSALRPGMIISNEPGLYHNGQYGIRIENLVVNQIKVFAEQQYGSFLCFETLTLCPIHQAAIVVELLSYDEIQWLNDYHQKVRQQLAPHLEGTALAWLMQQTQAIYSAVR